MQKAPVLVITSQVVRGRVGARACGFALERLGHPAWILPTILLPYHPGHGRGTRIVAPAEDFSALIEDLIGKPWLAELGGVITGYLGHAKQAGAIARLILALKAKNPGLLYCCDPVIGDEAGLYVPEATAVAIRDELLPLADIITPNRHEFAWLTGGASQKAAKAEEAHLLDSNEMIVTCARKLAPRLVAVTSAFAMMKNAQATLLYDRSADAGYLAEHRSFDQVPNGPGDLFSGLLMARLLEGAAPERALQLSTASVFEIIAQSVRRGADELCLIEEQARLETPMAMVTLRRIGAPALTRKGMIAKPIPLE